MVKKLSLNGKSAILIPLIVLVSGIILTFLVFLMAKSDETKAFRYDFDSDASSQANLIKHELDEGFIIIKSLQLFYNGSKSVELDEFTSFATPLLNEDSILKALEWVKAVNDNERASFEEANKSRAPDKFNITQKGEDRKLIRAKDRKQYYPVIYTESHLGIKHPTGYDLGSEQILNDAILQ
jgi:CHASE1-domain containing sensor protein